MGAGFSISNACFCFLLMSLFLVAYSNTDLRTDAMALLALKARLLGNSSTLNWFGNATTISSASSACTWSGVTCDSLHGRVVGLNLSDMGLVGSLPPEMGNLTFLISLDMSGNHFHGNLPMEWSGLRRLQYLHLRGNDLSGEVPRWIGFLSELRQLRLNNNSFSGSLPDSIGNASKLERLVCYVNQMEGPIPASVFNLSNLQVVTLGGNNFVGRLPSNLCSGFPKIVDLRLQNNFLEGEIPSNISACAQLQVLILANNRLSGSIPPDMSSPFSQLYYLSLAQNRLVGELPKTIGEWKALQILNLRANNITGIIPPRVSNLTNSQQISFSRNKITGTIPEEIGRLGNLNLFSTSFNNLVGELPQGIFNISSLEHLSIVHNNLTGQLPTDFCSRLPNLLRIYLGSNHLLGELPASISNCSKLEVLDIGTNSFGGVVPNTLGEMRFLWVVNIQLNNFGGKSSPFGFLTSLANCHQLNRLILSGNPFGAMLPDTVGNLSSDSFEWFECVECGLHGTIPMEFGNLTNLVRLLLSTNNLVGSIPTTLGKLQNLQQLKLGGNNLSGFIPHGLCNLQSINYMNLGHNQIGGSIPTCIGNLTSLTELSISDNKLESAIPSSFWQLSHILQLDLSNNLLNGSINPGIENFKVAYFVDLSLNKFSGIIPTSVGDMQHLEVLFLTYNKLEGTIPESLGTIFNLKVLNLSHNSFSGRIPTTLQNISSLVSFDVSFNNLSGPIPKEGPFHNFSYRFFESNEGLCGESQFHVPPCKPLKYGTPHKWKSVLPLIIILPIVLVLCIALLLGYVAVSRSTRRRVLHIEEDQPSLSTLLRVPTRIPYHTILQATKNFNDAHLLGSGAFGSVYKGILSDHKIVAIKIFNPQYERALRSFDVECSVLRNLRHTNLCKVISACSNEDIKALVMEYMPNGNLEHWLHGECNFLNISQRFSIVIDIASAVQYLHEGCTIPIVHCDLKPSNILLDEGMIAYLTDFGIAKLLRDTDVIAQTHTFATLGYMAPEYGSSGLVSKRCDVYSFGIVLMEVFTGRRPCDAEFVENDLSLRDLVKESMPDGVLHIVDQRLLNQDDAYASMKLNCLSSVMELSLKCSMENPSERITMKDVIASLKIISQKLSRTSL